MRTDWFNHGNTLLKPLIVKSLQGGDRLIDYFEGELSRTLAAMSRDDLEVLALCAVMFGSMGTADNLQMKRQ